MEHLGRIAVSVVVMSCVFLLCLIVQAVNPESAEEAGNVFLVALMGTSGYIAFGGRERV